MSQKCQSSRCTRNLDIYHIRPQNLNSDAHQLKKLECRQKFAALSSHPTLVPSSGFERFVIGWASVKMGEPNLKGASQQDRQKTLQRPYSIIIAGSLAAVRTLNPGRSETPRYYALILILVGLLTPFLAILVPVFLCLIPIIVFSPYYSSSSS